jgi:dolichol kinase
LVSKATILEILVPLTLAFGLTDVARLIVPSFRQFYHRSVGWLLRAHEKSDQERRLNGATYVLLSATIGILLFPKVIIITSFAILIISDTIAALIGRKYGHHRFLKKSLEGTIAFVISGVVVVLLSPKIGYLPAEYTIGILGAVVGGVVEASSIGIDDNLSIPFSIGGVMWLLYLLLIPTVNVFALDIV